MWVKLNCHWKLLHGWVITFQCFMWMWLITYPFSFSFLQWAKIIIVLERAHSQKKLVEFQENYSVDMLGGKEGDRGLMVIKTSKKTRARQRKGAINNWKVGRNGFSDARAYSRPVPSQWETLLQSNAISHWLVAFPRFVPRQWETPLLCNAVSHWLGANLESALVLC